MASIYTFRELSTTLEAAREQSAYRSRVLAESRKDLEEWMQTHHCIKTMHRIKYYDLERYGYYVYVQGATIDPHTVKFISVELFDRFVEKSYAEIEMFREQSNAAFSKLLKAEKAFVDYVKALSKEERRDLGDALWRNFGNALWSTITHRSCA